MIKVLLVEDDKSIVNTLIEFLLGEGYQTENAAGQREAIRRLSEGSYDLILLDVSLTDGSGFAVCSYARENSDAPVIFLTAADDEYSVVTGLDMGADDYIIKPFRPRELLSRMRSALRRSGKTQTTLEYHGLRADMVKGTVTRNGQELFLSALEYRLLLVFLNNPGMILTRSKLLEEIWDIAGEYVNDNTLTVYIKRLREKIEQDPQNPEVIKTIRGLGYRMGD